MSIQVSNITKLYGEQKALDNISFSIQSGEIVGFLGPNGAGKSTMMKIITCFIPQSEGDVKVCEFDVVTQSIDVRRKVGYLPENNPLYLDMFVKEYLEFAGGIFKIANLKNRIDEMISLTGLELEYKKKIGQLSKGYRQRVGLAQALIHNPEVLILDEPTSGLDPNQIVEIRELIRNIGKEKTIMLSTHIMQEVEAICDRVIIINQGKIVADAPTKEIHALSSSKNIIRVEFNTAFDISKLSSIQGILKVIKSGENEFQIHTNTNKDIRSEIFKFAVENKLEVLSMNKEEQSLENIFHQLTKK
ncbi:MAG: gliding motility-associated ABC transporter ATP-binding subunit GldA [Bacteroidota bacterium]